MKINLTFTTIIEESEKDYFDPEDPRNDTLIWFLAGTIVQSILDVEPIEQSSLLQQEFIKEVLGHT